jgi:hypothetical protein
MLPFPSVWGRAVSSIEQAPVVKRASQTLRAFEPANASSDERAATFRTAIDSIQETVGRAMKAAAFSNSAPGGAEGVALGNTGKLLRS